MKKLLPFFLTALLSTHAFALAPNDSWQYIDSDGMGDLFLAMMPDPGAHAIVGWDPNSTLGRAGIGGTGSMGYYTPGNQISFAGNQISFVSSAKTFNYPSRSLNSCYQINGSLNADFHYKVDVATGLSLTSGAQGTVTATSYTNSSCTTGAQVISDGTSSQTGTLVVGLGINQTTSIGLDGTLPANHWMKITTANTVGTPTFSIRSVQAESY